MGRHVRQVFEGAQTQQCSAGQRLYESGSEPDFVYYVATGVENLPLAVAVTANADDSHVGRRADEAVVTKW